MLLRDAFLLILKLGGPPLAVALLGSWGAAMQASIVQPGFIMVTRPDTRAMDWIRSNTLPEARFLVEGFRVYKGATAVGSDAGWWIPLLAGRANTMPPQYALADEVPIQQGYTAQVVNTVAKLENVSPASPEGFRLLCDWPVAYVYVGQGQGAVGAGARVLYTPEQLAGSPLFKQVYHQDRVYIFALNRSFCEASAG